MAETLDVITLGDVNVDVIAHYPEFPSPSQDSFAHSLQVRCGGSAANTAIWLGRLGFRVGLIGRIGRDPWAAIVRRGLRRAGVVLSDLQTDPAATTGLIYVIVTPGGERTMLSFRGANARTDPALLRQEAIRATRLFHLSGYALLTEPQRSAALSAWRTALDSGVLTALDPGLGPAALSETRTLVPQAGLLLPTLAEARLLTGLTTPADCARALLDQGTRQVVMKLGREGCLIADPLGLAHVPAFPIEALDTTGAGDAFDAGFLAGVLGGVSGPCAAILGNALGALVAARAPADTRALARRELVALLTSHQQNPAFAEHSRAMARALEFVRHMSARTLLPWRNDDIR